MTDRVGGTDDGIRRPAQVASFAVRKQTCGHLWLSGATAAAVKVLCCKVEALLLLLTIDIKSAR